jgi:hypothetical protein
MSDCESASPLALEPNGIMEEWRKIWGRMEVWNIGRLGNEVRRLNPKFHHSNIPTFQYFLIPSFQLSNIRPFPHSIIPMFHYSSQRGGLKALRADP